MRAAIVLAMSVVAGCSSPAPNQAVPSLPLTSPAPSAAAVEYVLDPSHTQIVFSVERFGFNRVYGFFEDITGEIVLDEANPERSFVHAKIPVASLNTGNPERDGFLRGEFWLKGQAYPTIEFRSTAVRLVGKRQAEVSGALNMAGVTAPAAMTVSLNLVGLDPQLQQQAAGFSATGALRRAAFGVRTAPQIGNEVTFSIEALAHANVEKLPVR